MQNFFINKIIITCFTLVFFLSLLSCRDESKNLTILSGSENESLEPIINQFADENNITIKMKYKGSVDIMMELGNENLEYDSVWPASSLWISLGDANKKVKHLKSIMTSPVVFGIRKSLAVSLGFVDKDVYVRDILDAIRTKKLKFIMTSATQSNSGTSAYLGFLYALLGNPDMITEKDLTGPVLKRDMKELLKGINRSSGSSGWLKDLFLDGKYDAMVNYESLIFETNKTLVSRGEEPLYLVYPLDGIAIADSPLGYINSGNPKKEETFKKLQEYLLSEKIQSRILQSGRRVGFGGALENADKAIFNPDWGVDSKKILSPIKYPGANIIRKALTMYQEDFRKGSYTVFCLDYSDSMSGRGEQQLKEAMDLLLDEKKASRYFINFSSSDKVIVIPFNNKTIGKWRASGNKKGEISGLNSEIKNLQPYGSTDIYSPLVMALDELSSVDTEEYTPAIILMTDGVSNVGKSFSDVELAYRSMDRDIPIFSIMFGNASEDQLREISKLTHARIFDGRVDLIQAFKTAKGYN